ncbi:MAG: TadE/TadG family type IV pilus assembly protein [Armatimonadota bacterium]
MWRSKDRKPQSKAIYRRGAALVETAISITLLLLLLMGILEFGILYGNYLSLAEVARDACRSAALGSSTSVVRSRITEAATALGMNMTYPIVSYLEYRTYDKASGTWSGWGTLGDSGAYNNAPVSPSVDSQVRVRLVYTYVAITGTFLSSVFGEDGNVRLTGTAVMRREET